MAAIGLYSPITILVFAIGMLFAAGSQLLSSKYMGKHQIDHTQAVFTLNIIVTFIIGAILAASHVLVIPSGLTDALSDDPVVTAYLDQYLLGKAIGVLPLMLSMQLSAFLSVENQVRRTSVAGIIFVIANLAFHVLFVGILHMDAFGLALAGSLGSWVFIVPLAQPYVTGKSSLKFSLKAIRWREVLAICKLGSPDALINLYFAVRALIFNSMIVATVGTMGLSAYATVYTFAGVFWALPDGMVAVSRMLIGVSVGEEDRQTLVDIMRVVFRRYLPLMIAVTAVIVLCAEPLTNLYYHDPADPVYQMTLWGFRIFPWCLPLSIVSTHFICYGNAMDKPILVHTLTISDGIVAVLVFGAILLPVMQLNGAYLAYVLRGVASCTIIAVYAWVCNHRFPRSLSDLMVIPPSFGVSPEARLDLTVRNIDEVVTVSQQVRAFCESRGIDSRRTFLSGLCLEEMAGNVVNHGFAADHKKHSIDIRVVHKDESLILRIKDDCIPFDPTERAKIVDPKDKASNIGIRIVYEMATAIDYQHLLGVNVLTIRI